LRRLRIKEEARRPTDRSAKAATQHHIINDPYAL